MKTKVLTMQLDGDDKAFFGITGLLGTITEFEHIMQAQLIHESIFMVIFKASAIAFISGFIGLFAKKLAETIYDKFKCN